MQSKKFPQMDNLNVKKYTEELSKNMIHLKKNSLLFNKYNLQ
jgi:hypothetical protein